MRSWPVDSRILIGAAAAFVLVAWAGWAVARDEPVVGRGSRTNRRSLVRLGAVLGLGLAGLAARLVSITVTNANQTSDRRGISPDGEVLSNPRLISQQLTASRGRILDRNGEPLAYSEADRAGIVRVFPVPEAAHILGYFSPLRFGTAGIEDSRNGTLTGSEPLTLRESLEVGLLARTLPGHDVRLTVDLELQRLAASLLQGSTGSALLIDHRTGKILAMASSPAYDPAALNAATEDQAASADRVWANLAADERHPLISRPTNGLYPPGSTFKVLVAAAAVDAGVIGSETTYIDEGTINVDGYVIPDFARPDTGQTEWTVREGIEWSLNVVFAQIGLDLGSALLWEYANRFGIGAAVPFELPTAAGQIASARSALNSRPTLAATSFGQGELLVTPLHMARVMMGVANGGVIMRPQLVEAVLSESGGRVSDFGAEQQSTPVSTATSATMMDMLYDSVTYGYASGAQIADLRVAGKTGTAEAGSDTPHGWFIGCAGVDEPVVTVAVCLEFGGEGGGLAAQIGRQLLDAAVER
jgi:peptidoglycan glycosyltransferase